MLGITRLLVSPFLGKCSLFLACVFLVWLLFHTKTKRIQRKYRHILKSYNRWLAILNDTGNSWVFIDNQLTYVNPYGSLFGIDILNVDKKEVIPKLLYEEFLDIFMPAEAPTLRLKVTCLKNKELTNFSTIITLKSGEKQRIEGKSLAGHITLLFYDESTNISERQIHSDVILNLVKIKTLLISLVNLINIPVWARDKKGKMLVCNTEYSKVVNKDENSVLANNIHLWRDYHCENESLSDNTLINGEKRIIGGNGYLTYHFHEELKNDIVFGFAHNISTQQEQQKALDMQHNSTTKILKNILSPVIILDHNKNLSFFNNAYADFFGFETEWLEDKPNLKDILSNLYNRGICPNDFTFEEYLAAEQQMLDHLNDYVQKYENWRGNNKLNILRCTYSENKIIYIFQKQDSQSLNSNLLNLVDEGLIIIDSQQVIKFANNKAYSLWEDETKLENTHLDNNKNPKLTQTLKSLIEVGGSKNFVKDETTTYNLTHTNLGDSHLIKIKDDTALKHMYDNMNKQQQITPHNGVLSTEQIQESFSMLCETLKNLQLEQKPEIQQFLELHNYHTLAKTYQHGSFIPEFENHNLEDFLKEFALQFKKSKTVRYPALLTCSYPQKNIKATFDPHMIKEMLTTTLTIFTHHNNVQLIISERGNLLEITIQPWAENIISMENNNSITVESQIESPSEQKNKFDGSLDKTQLLQKLELIVAILTTHGGKIKIVYDASNDQSKTQDSHTKQKVFNSLLEITKYLNSRPHAKILKITCTISCALYIHASAKEATLADKQHLKNKTQSLT